MIVVLFIGDTGSSIIGGIIVSCFAVGASDDRATISTVTVER